MPTCPSRCCPSRSTRRSVRSATTAIASAGCWSASSSTISRRTNRLARLATCSARSPNSAAAFSDRPPRRREATGEGAFQARGRQALSTRSWIESSPDARPVDPAGRRQTTRGFEGGRQTIAGAVALGAPPVHRPQGAPPPLIPPAARTGITGFARPLRSASLDSVAAGEWRNSENAPALEAGACMACGFDPRLTHETIRKREGQRRTSFRRARPAAPAVDAPGTYNLPTMQTTNTPLPKSRLQLEFELPPERLSRAIDQAVGRLGRQTRVPGFRPGKAPRVMLERVLGQRHRRRRSAYWMGFKQYSILKEISLPHILGVQAVGSAPLVLGHPVDHPETVATAIRIGKPARGEQALQAAEESHGRIIAVTDDEILEMQKLLASSGIWVEPASAAGLAGLKHEIEMGQFDATGKKIVVVCTGHGLKDPEIVTRGFSFRVLPSEFKAIESAITGKG